MDVFLFFVGKKIIHKTETVPLQLYSKCLYTLIIIVMNKYRLEVQRLQTVWFRILLDFALVKLNQIEK